MALVHLKAIKQGVTLLVKHTNPNPFVLAFNPFSKKGSLMIIGILRMKKSH